MTDAETTAVLYHADCVDGLASAWAAWKHLGPEATYVAVYHKAKPPKLPDNINNVFLLDFCYMEREHMLFLTSKYRVTIIDHHAEAVKKALSDPDVCSALAGHLFDPSRSGAGLSWSYFHPEKGVPEVLLYVQDRDLWNWDLPESREVGAFLAALDTKKMTFEEFDALVQGGASQMKMEGKVIKRIQEAFIARIARSAFDVAIETPHGQAIIPCVNSPILQSEIGNVLCQGRAFAAVWNRVDASGKILVSLRASGDSTINLALVAEMYGGGGHPNAAGCAAASFADIFKPVPSRPKEPLTEKDARDILDLQGSFSLTQLQESLSRHLCMFKGSDESVFVESFNILKPLVTQSARELAKAMGVEEQPGSDHIVDVLTGKRQTND